MAASNAILWHLKQYTWRFCLTISYFKSGKTRVWPQQRSHKCWYHPVAFLYFREFNSLQFAYFWVFISYLELITVISGRLIKIKLLCYAKNWNWKMILKKYIKAPLRKQLRKILSHTRLSKSYNLDTYKLCAVAWSTYLFFFFKSILSLVSSF